MKTAKIIFIAGCVVGAGVVGGAGYLLYDGIRTLREQTRRLEDALNERGRYYRNNPFPRPENVEIEKQNALAIESAFTNLLARLADGQVQPPQLTPSTFMRLLGTTQQALVRAAGKSDTKDFATVLPENFAFGFDPYFAGTMRPKPEHVEELTRQLLILERLFRIVFEAGMDGIVSVQREEFESRPLPERTALLKKETETPLHSKHHFVFVCRAKDGALLKALNRLAADRMFAVVTSVAVKKESPDILEVSEREEQVPAAGRAPSLAEIVGATAAPVDGKPPAEKPKRKPEDMLRDERVVCGPRLEQPANVTLEVDVYRFKGD